jgi:hypothetical protein
MTDTKNISEENIAAIFVDKEKNERYIFTRDQIINQLQRVCPEINKSFDAIFAVELKELSSDLSEIMAIQFVGYRNAQESEDKLLVTCGNLLRNSVNTIIAASQTLRCGFRLQSGILLRSVIEICATVVHLLVKPEDLNQFLNDKLTSTKSISIADKQVPFFGRIWGVLSKKQIHINSLHTDWYPLKEYKDKDEVPASVTLGMLGVSTMILRIVTELTFINELQELKYWEVIKEGKVKFIPPDNSKISWIEKILNN